MRQIEQFAAFFFLMITIEAFSSGGSGSAADGSQDRFWQLIAVALLVSLFVAGAGLLATRSYWFQLFLLPALFVVLFFAFG